MRSGPCFIALQLRAHHLQGEAGRNASSFTAQNFAVTSMQKLTHSLVKMSALRVKHSNASSKCNKLVNIYINGDDFRMEESSSFPT